MHRTLRIEYPGAVYHPLALQSFSATRAMNRGHQRELIFYDDLAHCGLCEQSFVSVAHGSLE